VKFRIYDRRQTNSQHTHTHRQTRLAHRSTPLPYRGRSNKMLCCWEQEATSPCCPLANKVENVIASAVINHFSITWLLWSRLTRFLSCPPLVRYSKHPLYSRRIGLTSPTKPEVHNVLQCCQKRTEPRPQAT